MATENACVSVNYSSSSLCSPQIEPSYFDWKNSSATVVLHPSGDIHGNTHQLQWPASPYVSDENNGLCCTTQFPISCSGVPNVNAVPDNLQRYDTFSASSLSNTSPLSHLPDNHFDTYSNLSPPTVDCPNSDCSFTSPPTISCFSSPCSELLPPAYQPDPLPPCGELSESTGVQATKEGKKPVQMRNRQPRTDRLCFTPEQLQQLEASFERDKYLNHIEREQLSAVVGVTTSQIKTWYQNRRAKWKKTSNFIAS